MTDMVGYPFLLLEEKYAIKKLTTFVTMSYRIGSFNLYKAKTHVHSDTMQKEYSLIAKIIRDNQFDIVAFQEVFNPGVMEQITRELGPANWAWSWDSPRAASALAAEGYAFLWNTKRFKLATRIDQYGNEKIVDPRIYQQYSLKVSSVKLRMRRDPYVARFIPVYGPFIEIRLIDTHILFSASSDSEDSISAQLMRKGEFQILTQALYPKVADHANGNNRVPYTFVLGDYNLNLRSFYSKPPYIEERVFLPNKDAKANALISTQKQLTTLKQKVEQVGGSYWANNYDHFTYDEDYQRDWQIETYRINSVESVCKGDFQMHRKAISDHVPVCLEMHIRRTC